MGPLRYQSRKLLKLVDKEAEEGKDNEEVPPRPLIRRRHEITDAVEVYSKERAQSAGPSKALDTVPEAGEESNCEISSSLKETLKLFREGLVGEPKFRSL